MLKKFVWKPKKRVTKGSISAPRKSSDLECQLEQSQEDCKSQEQLISTACHELRNPLTGIIGNTDALGDELAVLEEQLQDSWEATEIPEGFYQKLVQYIAQTKEAIHTIDQCARFQKSIADDMLDLAKLKAHKVELHVTAFDPQKIIEDVMNMLKVKAREKNIQLQQAFFIKKMIVSSDPDRLAQVLINLVSNAIKFTPKEGKITVKLQQKEETTTHITLLFVVEDTGIGMTPQEQEKIFSPFMQASSHIHSKYGGSGLGLAISKNLVELMGGKISVTSEKGRGSTFTVAVPCGNVLQLEVTPPHEPVSCIIPFNLNSPKRRCILIVKDNRINQKVLQKHLSQEGHYCLVASNGQEAVFLWEQNIVDIILMDLEMPVMNGFEATAVIRQKEKEKQDCVAIPIIGLSGSADEEQITKAKRCGMTDYLVKPYDKAKLREKIVFYTKRLVSASAGLFSEEKGISKSKNEIQPVCPTMFPLDKKEELTTTRLLTRFPKKQTVKQEKDPTKTDLISAPFQSQKAQSMQTFKQKLAEIGEKNSYTFSIKSSQPDLFHIQFTAMDSVSASVENIRAELIALAELFRHLLAHGDISIKLQQNFPSTGSKAALFYSSSTPSERLEEGRDAVATCKVQ